MALVTSSSGDVIQMMILATMLSCGLTVASGECPRGCFCDDVEQSVLCSNLDSFPTIPATPRVIHIRKSNFSEIPSGAFNNLPHLVSITFEEVIIGTIRPRAFYRMAREVQMGKTLVFHRASIGNIEGGAFQELDNFFLIMILESNISNVSSGAFSNLNNIQNIDLQNVDIPIIRSATFTSINHVKTFSIARSTFHIIEKEAFSNITLVESFIFSNSSAGAIGSHFLTLTDSENVNVNHNNFQFWDKCTFCGINSVNVSIHDNIVIGSDGNVFSNMNGVTSLQIYRNALPLIVARFFPFDLETLEFYENIVTTILCQAPGTDYPSTIDYKILDNEVTCDCRLNWMWMKWRNTRALQELTSGFVCAGPDTEKTSLFDFLKKVSTSANTLPCNVLKAVNDCGTFITDARLETSTIAGLETTTDINSSSVANKSGWISALAFVLILMA